MFGLTVLAWPGITLPALAVLFGICVLADGVSTSVASLLVRERGWRVLLFEGLLLLAVGVAALSGATTGGTSVLTLIAARAIIVGGLEVGAAVQLRREGAGEWMLGLASVISVLVGEVILVAPTANALVLLWLIGLYSITYGALMIPVGYRLKGRGASMTGPAAA